MVLNSSHTKYPTDLFRDRGTGTARHSDSFSSPHLHVQDQEEIEAWWPERTEAQILCLDMVLCIPSQGLSVEER